MIKKWIISNLGRHRGAGRIVGGAGVRVSVIVPVFNVEQYLRQCLSSLVCQSLDNVEVICVDDCSTDESHGILSEYACENDSFTVITHEKNRGLSAARNTGLDIARGEYIYFIDSDDFLADNQALERLYRAAHADDADEVIGGIIHWREHTDETSLDWDENYLGEEVHARKMRDIPGLRCNVIAVNKLMRRSLLDENAVRFCEGIRKYEDNPFSCMVHLLASRISVIPKTSYVYRRGRQGAITVTENKEEAYFKVCYCSIIFEFIESAERFHRYREIYYPMYVRQLILGAGILAQHSPSIQEKLRLLAMWSEVLEVLPEDLQGVPERLSLIVKLVREGKMDEAWERAVLIRNR